ncbi:MAG TPA: TonB-dependent receptor [Candidatus Limnocylindria bacterium]|nr:TonB-dependent receptor [Candidatus Limnocylindria bacterium]
MKKQAILGWILVLCLALGLGTSSTLGQAVYGNLVGAVTDPQGSAVAGAKVTVTNISKGTTEETTTNESGSYSVTHLMPDSYKVHVEAPGFKAYDIASIRVDADTTVRADAALQVGAVTQTVEVTGEVPQLQTDKTDVATVFESRTVEDLPIYNRNFTSLQLLSPGAQRLNWGHAASENPQGSQQIETNGQHFAGTAFELDGTDNQDPILGIIVINPNLDAISEAKITSQDYDAEFGKAIGAIVTTQTKSGTNEIHGSVFDFERSNSNFARNPFNQQSGVPSGNWNQFGGTVGGPIKKNKLFAFGDYQGLRSHVGGSFGSFVPTAAMRSGDLSALITGCPTNTQPCTRIYDPFATTDAAHTTLALSGGNPIFLAPADRVQTSTNCPAGDFCGVFPGNIIPASRLTQPGAAQAQALLALFKGPTNSTILGNNYFASGNNTLDSNGFDVRSDFVATSKVNVFGRYSFQQFKRSGPGLFGVNLGGHALPSDPSVGDFAGDSKVRNQSIAAGFDFVLSSTFLTDVRFGYMRYHVNVSPGGFGTTPVGSLNPPIPGINLNSNTSAMPAFTIHTPNASDFQFGYSLGVNQCNCPLTESEHQYQFVNNWTNIRGKHTIKFGADVRYAYNLRVPSDSHRAGQLDFNNDITVGPGGDGGAGLAGFLLGQVSHFERYVSNSLNAYETQPRLFFYGQDTIRLTSKLTFNAGLRWEIYRPESAAAKDGGGWVDLTTGEMRIAGETGVNLRGNTTTGYKHFAPRLGVAYQANTKTVVRLGYGRSYDIGVFGSIFGHAITQNLPVLGAQQMNANTGSSVFNLAVGPPSFDPATKLGGMLATSNCNAITDPSGVVGGVFTPDKAQCLGVNGRPFVPDGVFSRSRPFNNRLPTVDQWNVSVQRQVTSTLSATLAYVGNKGTHTFAGGGPAYGANEPTVVGYKPNGGISKNQRRPFYSKYGWTQGIDYFGNDADNHFDSLQATVEKRYAGGLSLQSSYTFQHSTNYDSNYYNIDRKIAYGPNDDYRNHMFILTEVYDLPFGHGKKWAGNVGRATDLAIGGWSINSATTIASGLPFTPGLNNCGPEIDVGPCKPDLLGSVKNGTRSGHPDTPGYWFQTTGGASLGPAANSLPTAPGNVCTGGAQITSGPWGQPGCDAFGSIGRNALRGPKLFDTDFSLFKTFSFTEKFKTQFQFQAFNVFNHVNLDRPDGCVDCSNGGRITNLAFGSTMRRLQFGLKLNF